MTKFEALFTDNYKNVGYNVKRKETIGNYLLGRTLGEGTFAKVKKALHLPTGERVCWPFILGIYSIILFHTVSFLYVHNDSILKEIQYTQKVCCNS